jgi:hypothetical protein
VDQLERIISKAAADPSMFRSRSDAAKRRASEFTWEKFRAGVREAAAHVAKRADGVGGLQ